MIRAIMHGCNGAMGQTITQIAQADGELAIVAGIDPTGQGQNPYPVFPSLEACSVEADVVIDFSIAGAADAMLDWCGAHGMPAVVCTTGFSEKQLEKLMAVSEKTAILRSANMSLGINVLLKLLKEAARVLAAADFDIEIIEKHHNQKVDAPSGTALALAASVNEELGGAYEYVYDRSGVRQKRSKKEIGISAVRGGTIVGDHDVIFAGADEVITFSHTAYSKAVFAKGAIQAAKFLAGKPAGMYDMSDVIEAANNC